MTRKNLETLVKMIHHVQIESNEEEEEILDLYYHLRLAVEREEQATEEPKVEAKPRQKPEPKAKSEVTVEKPQAEAKPRKKPEPKAKSEVPVEKTEESMPLKKGTLTREETALKQETYDKLQSGAYMVGELSEESGLSVGTILDMKGARKVNIAFWKRLADAMDKIDVDRGEEA